MALEFQKFGIVPQYDAIPFDEASFLSLNYDIDLLPDFGIADFARLNLNFKAFISASKYGLSLQYIDKQGEENSYATVAKGFHDHSFHLLMMCSHDTKVDVDRKF